MSLQLNGAPGIVEIAPNSDREQDTPLTYKFPATNDSLARDSDWTAALDTLRNRRQHGETFGEWRRRASFRPVVFDDPGRLGENAVQLHLEHRVAQRLLGRFTAQGLIHHDLSKACLTCHNGCNSSRYFARTARLIWAGRSASARRDSTNYSALD